MAMTKKPPRPPAPVVFLSVVEVAELLRISQGYVYKMLKNGILPYIRCGNHYRIHVKDLRVLAPNYVPPEPAPVAAPAPEEGK